MSNLFNLCAFLQADPSIFNIRKIQYQFFSTVFVSSVSKLPLFFPPSFPLFFFKDPDFLFQHPFIAVKSFHSFPSMFLSGDCHEDVLLVHHSPFSFFSGGFKSSFVDHILSSFQMFSHAGAPLNHPLLAIQLFRSAQDISKIRVSTLLSFKFFRGCSLIQAI